MCRHPFPRLSTHLCSYKPRPARPSRARPSTEAPAALPQSSKRKLQGQGTPLKNTQRLGRRGRAARFSGPRRGLGGKLIGENGWNTVKYTPGTSNHVQSWEPELSRNRTRGSIGSCSFRRHICQHAGVPPAAVGAIRRAATKINLTGIPLVFGGWEVPPAYMMYIGCIDMYIDVP